MKVHFGTALAAAFLIAGCSSGSKETRTASNEPTNRKQPGSVEGTQGTAGGSTSTQGTATASGTSRSGDVSTSDTVTGSTSGMGGSATGSVGTQTNPSDTGSSTSTASTGSAASGQTSPPPITTSPGSTLPGSTTAQSGTTGQTGTAGSTATGSERERDTAGTTPPSTTGTTAGTTTGETGPASAAAEGNLKSVTGQLAKVDQSAGSITLDEASGGLTLKVDSQTKILRRGQTLSTGISALREGEQVRASFDPASNRAEKIEVMGKAKNKGAHDKTGAPGGATTPPDKKY